MIVLKKVLGTVASIVIGSTVPQLSQQIAQATASVARREDTALTPAEAPAVAREIAASIPAPQAMVPLGPQLVRYLISWTGLWLVQNGYATASEVEMITGALMAIGPPLWLVVSTRVAQWRAKAV